jgi:hypothetical protein
MHETGNQALALVQIVSAYRAPTLNDKGYNIGTRWVNFSVKPADPYMLIDFVAGGAVWVLEINTTTLLDDGEILIGRTGLTPVANTITAGLGIVVTSVSGAITISTNIVAPVMNYTPTAGPVYDVLVADYNVGVDSSGGLVTVRLIDAPVAGSIWVIKDATGTANTNNITVTSVAGATTIDGALTYTMNVDYQSIMVQFTGTEYLII